MTDFLYTSRIARVQFSLSGSEAAVKESYATIVNVDLFKDGKPAPQGMYDDHLGTTDHSFRCKTCQGDKVNCFGHEGHIKLNYPVFNTRGITDLPKWLKCICFDCGKPVLPDSKFINYPAAERLDVAQKAAKSYYEKGCFHCGVKHPIVTKRAKEMLAFEVKWPADMKNPPTGKILLPHYVKQVLDRVEPETVIALGRDIKSHPKHLVLSSIKVMSSNSRPDVKRQGGGRSTNDPITTVYQLIIRKNEKMPLQIPETIDSKFETKIMELCATYYELANAKGDEAMQSIGKRIKGKKGRVRENLLGKRTFSMARSFIIGDISLNIDEVGVPLAFARAVQIQDYVQEWNKAEIIQMIQNFSTGKYPACSRVIKKNGSEHAADKALELLEPGDMILRDIIDGDYVGFNRQPSVTISQICAHRAKIIHDDSVKTLVMNVITCNLYGADFDGDAMNLIIVASSAGRNEYAMLSTVASKFISHESSSPKMGQVDDSKIGSSELTRANVMLKKFSAMALFASTSYLPDFSAAPDKLTGLECVSYIFDETPINYSCTPKWYDPKLARYVTYDPREIKTQITRGKMISGVLDSKSISAANGSLCQSIAYEYGNQRALEVMYNIQQLAIAYTLLCGMSIGISDIIIPQSAKQQINEIIAEIIHKSQVITEKLVNGEIIPPINKTVDQFYEDLQIDILSHRDDFNEPLFGSLDFATNTFLKLFMFGSKGSLDNIRTITTASGSKLINGQRMRETFGYKRTLAYFPRFATSPESRGYVANSFMAGLTSSEYVFSAMGTRSELISKALSTADTGDMNRKSTKNMESNITNNYRWTTKDVYVVQFAYGEDFLDPTQVTNVLIPTIKMNDADFDALKHPDFPDFHAKLAADRKEYRKLFMAIEHFGINDTMSDVRKLPVDANSIIQDAVVEFNSNLRAVSAAELKKIVADVEQMIDNIGYTLLNDIQEKQKSPIDEYLTIASWLMRVMLRAWLHPAAIVKLKLTQPIVGVIIDKIRNKYSRSLIDPGCAVGIISAMSFCRPMTQYVLDAHHRSAGAGTSKGGLVLARETFGAKAVVALKGPSMFIPIRVPECFDKAKVTEIAASIEVMYFRQFVSSVHMFACEQYGKPVHSKWVHHTSDIAEFNKLNPLLPRPADLISWSVVFMLDRTTMILKNMALETIIDKLRKDFPDAYFMYVPENHPTPYIRMYFRNGMFKKEADANMVWQSAQDALDDTIRGISGVMSTKVVPLIRSKIMDDGSVGKIDGSYAIATVGTNIADVVEVPEVDVNNVHSDAVQEIFEMYGIEAARLAIMQSLKTISEGINHGHYLQYADEMTLTGFVTPIEISGVRSREGNNVLLRIGYSHINNALEEAAVHAMTSNVYGVTGPLIVGDTPRIGTMYNQFIVDENFVRDNTKTAESILEGLL